MHVMLFLSHQFVDYGEACSSLAGRYTSKVALVHVSLDAIIVTDSICNEDWADMENWRPFQRKASPRQDKSSFLSLAERP